MYMKTVYLLILQLTISTLVFAQSKFEKQEFTSSSGTKMGYQMLKPSEIRTGKKYPLVLFLHGAGERGNDNEAQMTHGSRMFTNPVNMEKYPSFVIFPQCPADMYWSFEKRPDNISADRFESHPKIASPLATVKELLDWYIANFPVDKNRIYVMGLSMGGMATFDLACRFPDVFAAAVPICGGINVERLSSAAGKVKFRIFHGDADPVVPVDLSRSAYITLKKLNAQVEYIEFPAAGHDSWTPAFNRDDFMKWIYKKKK
ncbi:dienelactone hydrolase family protein [Paludibacter sp.]